jgi:hypothetical protein
MWAFAALLAASVNPCDVPRRELSTSMNLSYDAFDGRRGPYGWRPLLDAGCVDSVVSLLSAYSIANDARLDQAQRLEMQFHIGQALAMSGREKEAIAYFSKASAPDAPSEWRIYVEATLAFLGHDQDRLAVARSSYARVAPGSMRLMIIDGMVACPRESYAKAVHCRM